MSRKYPMPWRFGASALLSLLSETARRWKMLLTGYRWLWLVRLGMRNGRRWPQMNRGPRRRRRGADPAGWCRRSPCCNP